METNLYKVLLSNITSSAKNPEHKVSFHVTNFKYMLFTGYDELTSLVSNEELWVFIQVPSSCSEVELKVQEVANAGNVPVRLIHWSEIPREWISKYWERDYVQVHIWWLRTRIKNKERRDHTEYSKPLRWTWNRVLWCVHLVNLVRRIVRDVESRHH